MKSDCDSEAMSTCVWIIFVNCWNKVKLTDQRGFLSNHKLLMPS